HAPDLPQSHPGGRCDLPGQHLVDRERQQRSWGLRGHRHGVGDRRHPPADPRLRGRDRRERQLLDHRLRSAAHHHLRRLRHVQYHEYGHYVMDSFNFENNPGGAHNIGDCIVQVHGNNKSEGNRLAWGEGWPTYWGTTVQRDFGLPGAGIPTVGDATYTDTEAG